MDSEKPLYVAGAPNPDRMGFVPLRHSSGDGPDETGILTAAEKIGVPVKYVDADGYEREIIAGAEHDLGSLAYVQCRAKEIGQVVDINFHIHLRVSGHPDRSWPIKSYNPYFGCDVGLFTWLEETVLFIYREKHDTYVCVFGPTKLPIFKKIQDDWVISERTIGFWGYRESRVSLLTVPDLVALDPITEQEAQSRALLPPKYW
jgi:hypothetical protein